MADLLKSIGVPRFHIPKWEFPSKEEMEAKFRRVLDDAFKATLISPLAVPTVFIFRNPMQQALEKCGGDPDGDLVPLPVKLEPVRVVPEFPLTAYMALLK